MLLFKKIAGGLLSPLSIIVLAAALGIALLWFTRRQRLGKLLVTASFLLLVAGAYGGLAGPALHALERAHAPLAAPPADIKWIVVLGGGTWSDAGVPLVNRLTPSTLARLVEGVRLQRQRPGARLLVSGAPVFGLGSDAESMSALAAALGVAREDVVAEARSADTEEQARNVRAIVRGERIVLVTSAAHMRRSVAFFRRAGLDVLPAPADYLSHANEGLSPQDFFPGARRLQAADAVMHEYLGLAWARLTGRI